MASRLHSKTLLLLTLFGALAFGNAPAQKGEGSNPNLEIAKFRFKHHKKHNFERLVLEFKTKERHIGAPKIELTPSQNNLEAAINISGVTLIGAIPESPINDSYQNKSQFFGPIAINIDNPSVGFSVRASLRKPHTFVDAFWLQYPNRLVIDVFPANSLRTAGPNIVNEVATMKIPQNGDRQPASHSGSQTFSSPGKPKVLCFPNHSAVNLSVGFQNRTGDPVAARLQMEEEAKRNQNPNGIVCYPMDSQLTATLHFYQSDDQLSGHDRLGLNMQPTNQTASAPRQPASLSSGASLGDDFDFLFGGTSPATSVLPPSNAGFGNTDHRPAPRGGTPALGSLLPPVK